MEKIICRYVLFILLGCTACSLPSNQEIYKSLAHETWNRDSNYKFEISITQPGTYTMSTCIRHTTDYKNKNISCYLIISHANLPDITEMTEVTITGESGAWTGQGLGGLKTVIQPLKQVLHLDSTGIYTVKIRHRMKEKQLEGVKNIGIKITKYKN